MKIALLTDGIYPFVMGGMQRHSFYLAQYLAAAGVQVDLYHTGTTADQALTPFSAEARANIRSFVVPFPQAGHWPGHYVRESYQYATGVWEQFQQHSSDADFVYIKGFSGWKLLEAQARGAKLPPTGIKFHGYEMYQRAPSLRSKLEHFLLRPFVRWNTRAAHYVFSYGGNITAIVRRLSVPPAQIVEIPTGIAATWLTPPVARPGARRLVFVGRYERRKGIEELHAVLPDVLDAAPGEMHFVGPIPPDKQLRHPQITYHGPLTDSEALRHFLAGCDVLVCPSHAEGMPNVILEGMATGCAIVATDVGAVPAMLTPETGLLIAPGDPRVLRDALLTALRWSDGELLARQQAAYARAGEHFLWEHIAARTLDALRAIVARG
ncbi:MAG: hypothetical protein OHK0039_21180 [Bacteroidia bacterium]